MRPFWQKSSRRILFSGSTSTMQTIYIVYITYVARLPLLEETLLPVVLLDAIYLALKLSVRRILRCFKAPYTYLLLTTGRFRTVKSRRAHVLHQLKKNMTEHRLDTCMTELKRSPKHT